jgi:outer membrane receptor protein involved in Fe transport
VRAGLTFSLGGAVADVSYYHNRARNFLDHEQLGDSAVFLPVNVEEARLRGLEVSLSSTPGKPVRARFVYARGFAEARGAITGGLGDIEAATEDDWFFLDHDQRQTASASIDVSPHRVPVWGHVTVQYGSGFVREEGPAHLPSHVTTNCSAGWTLSHHVALAMEVENLTNREYLIALGSEFNGTHYARPRYVSGRLRLTF